MTRRDYDLEERLLEFCVAIIRLTEALPQTRAGNQVAAQLLRSGTSPHLRGRHPDRRKASLSRGGADFSVGRSVLDIRWSS